MKNVILFEQEGIFGGRFAEYFNRREGLPCRIQLFTDRSRLESFSAGRRIDLLICDEREKDKIKGIEAGRRLILSAGREHAGTLEESFVYKYQNAELLQKAVLKELSWNEEQKTAGRKRAKIYGVYSVGGFLESNLFALLLGQAVSGQRTALYLSLSELPGLSSLLEGLPDRGLSDALYFYEQGTLAENMEGIIGNWHQLSVLASVSHPEDVLSFDGEAVAGLAEELAAGGLYDVLVLDFGTAIGRALPLLTGCDLIFTKAAGDALEEFRLERFLDWIRGSLNFSAPEAPVLFSLPEVRLSVPAGLWLEEQLWGNTGKAVRELAAREGVI